MHFGLDCKIWCFLTFFLFLHVFTRFEKIDIENIPFLLWPETYLLQDLLLVVHKLEGVIEDRSQVECFRDLVLQVAELACGSLQRFAATLFDDLWKAISNEELCLEAETGVDQVRIPHFLDTHFVQNHE